jgi:hypothetical protein
MDRKPLIGVSICAVVLLVMSSLSNVVGYQSVKSTAVNDSPLFRTRTQKIINQQQNVLTSQYLGKGKGNLLYFPMRDNRTESLKRAIEIISKMDDNAFAQFTVLCIQRARQDNTLCDTNSNEIALILRQLRAKPETVIHSFIERTNNATTSDWVSCRWFPGCIPYLIISMILMSIFLLILTITYLINPPTYFMVNCKVRRSCFLEKLYMDGK